VKHGARNGREQLPMKSETMRPGASSSTGNVREQDRYLNGAEWRSTGREEERME